MSRSRAGAHSAAHFRSVDAVSRLLHEYCAGLYVVPAIFLFVRRSGNSDPAVADRAKHLCSRHCTFHLQPLPTANAMKLERRRLLVAYTEFLLLGCRRRENRRWHFNDALTFGTLCALACHAFGSCQLLATQHKTNLNSRSGVGGRGDDIGGISCVSFGRTAELPPGDDRSASRLSPTPDSLAKSAASEGAAPPGVAPPPSLSGLCFTGTRTMILFSVTVAAPVPCVRLRGWGGRLYPRL
jgi:hypothetical protein